MTTPVPLLPATLEGVLERITYANEGMARPAALHAQALARLRAQEIAYNS